MAARDGRQEALRKIVRSGGARTQVEIVEALKERGFEVTQATVSRDIAELDLRKGPGGYALPEDMRLAHMAANLVRSTARAGNQVVVHTDPGTAPGVAAAIDGAKASGVLGSIAGDDTVLVVAADEDAAARFQKDLDALVGT